MQFIQLCSSQLNHSNPPMIPKTPTLLTFKKTQMILKTGKASNHTQTSCNTQPRRLKSAVKTSRRGSSHLNNRKKSKSKKKQMMILIKFRLCMKKRRIHHQTKSNKPSLPILSRKLLMKISLSSSKFGRKIILKRSRKPRWRLKKRKQKQRLKRCRKKPKKCSKRPTS